MGNKGIRIAIAVAALVLMGGSAARADVPIGAHSMLQLDDPPSFMATMFAQAAAMHASAIRLDVAPALVFGSRSQPPDFSGLDDVVALAQSYHLAVVGDLMTIPAWMARCATPTGDPTRCATDDLAGYASVIRQIVARADPVIRDWEVWNEPDTSAFFDGTPQEYASMLRVAHDTIKEVDPADRVLLGGVSGAAASSWLAQVFATPGADAVHAFDIAALHERGDLWQLAADVQTFRRFLSASGFTGPLWVTEHGYPSDPQYQYDPGYTGGQTAQASYLAASIPTVVDAGAAEVFVTERDNLGAQFASEGVLGGDLSDPPPADPEIVLKPSFAAVQAIAECYERLDRDCPGAPPAPSPAALSLPPVPPGRTSSALVTFADPGTAPIELGAAAMTGAGRGLSVQDDGCAGQILEPEETCAVSVRFSPTAGADAAAELQLPSDDGTVTLPVTATSPSVSALWARDLLRPAFIPTRAGDGVGHPQEWVLALSNPLSAAVSVSRMLLSDRDARRFSLTSNHCAHVTVPPHGNCRVTVRFVPTRVGVAQARLTLEGAGIPLRVVLRPAAFALPAVTQLDAGHGGCAVRSAPRLSALTSQPATLRWTLTRDAGIARGLCPRATSVAGAPVATGTVATDRQVSFDTGQMGYAAVWRLGGRARLAPGAYVLSVTAGNAHGVGVARSIGLDVTP